jgi:hypothetical protein
VKQPRLTFRVNSLGVFSAPFITHPQVDPRRSICLRLEIQISSSKTSSASSTPKCWPGLAVLKYGKGNRRPCARHPGQRSQVKVVPCGSPHDSLPPRPPTPVNAVRQPAHSVHQRPPWLLREIFCPWSTFFFRFLHRTRELHLALLPSRRE